MDEKELMQVIERLRITGQEQHNIDAKQQLPLREVGDKAELAKDVAAMANNAATRYIVIGLEDGTFADAGKLEYHYTKSIINQTLSDKIDPPIAVDYQEFVVGENEYALLKILGVNPPYIIARDIIHNRADKKQVKIYKGMIYVRRQDITDGITRAELERINNKGITRYFQDDNEVVRKLVLEKPDYWEYLLTVELWRQNFIDIKRRLKDLDRQLLYARAKEMRGADFLVWTKEWFANFGVLMRTTEAIFNDDIAISWGAPGESGDPLEIKRCVNKLVSVCDELITWEAELHSINPPDTYIPLKEALEGCTVEAITKINNTFEELSDAITNPDPANVRYIHLALEAPDNIKNYRVELEKLQHDPTAAHDF